jgi:hypothetical protein
MFQVEWRVREQVDHIIRNVKGRAKWPAAVVRCTGPNTPHRAGDVLGSIEEVEGIQRYANDSVIVVLSPCEEAT